MIVCKFGGTSVAKLENAKKIKEIVKSNSNRKIVVVSALGKNENNSDKVTDMLFQLYWSIEDNQEYITIVNDIFTRYEDLSKKLHINIDWNFQKKSLLWDIENKKFSKEYIVSRGEYYSAILYSKYLNMKFVDAKDCIDFSKNKTINYTKTRKKLKDLLLKYKKFVVGGYYGADCNGNIVTFDRGGSDITGAIIAKLLNAEIYENYTDVDGVFDRNPNVFNNAKKLPLLNFKTAIQMADAGNEIVHKSALSELKNSNTVLIVKSTYEYKNLGTVVIDNNLIINDIFICLNNCYLLKFKEFNEVIKKQIKEKAQVQKLIKYNKEYYLIIKSIYDKIDNFKKLNSVISLEKVFVLTIFSNLKINNKTAKRITNLIKKVKRGIAFAQFLTYYNNFVLIFKDENLDKIVRHFNI